VWRLLSVLGELLLMAYCVYCLLVAYRRIGKQAGADPRYDAWFKQWSGTYKVIGWLGFVVLTFHLLGSLLVLLAKGG
jgi:hypothetical protein